jgi:pescadillo protein
LPQKLGAIAARDGKADNASAAAGVDADEMDIVESSDAVRNDTLEDLDTFPEDRAGEGESLAANATAVIAEAVRGAVQEQTILRRLFSSYAVFLSREVPRYSLEFVLRSCGAKKVGWPETSGSGSAFESESDPAINVKIVDRPGVTATPGGPSLVQPQWVFDCINARKILPLDRYAPGKNLPAHLSPFVEYKAGDYVPEEAAEYGTVPGSVLAKPQPIPEVDIDEAGDKGAEDADEGEEAAEEEGGDEEDEEIIDDDSADEDLEEDDDEDEDNEEEEEEVAAPSAKAKGKKSAPAPAAAAGKKASKKRKLVDEDEESAKNPDWEEEEQHRRELEAEAGGVRYTQKNQKSASDAKKAKTADEEQREFQKMMMSKRQRKLLNQIEFGQRRKAGEVRAIDDRFHLDSLSLPALD